MSSHASFRFMILCIALIACTLLRSLAVAQDLPKFRLTAQGVEPIILKFDSLTTDTLFMRTIMWMEQLPHRRRANVHFTDLPNGKIRISDRWGGEYRLLQQVRVPWYHYTLTMEFLDKEIKMTFELGTVNTQAIPFTEGLPVYDYHRYFKSTGELKHGCEGEVLEIEDHMNRCAKSLWDYLSGREFRNWY